MMQISLLPVLPVTKIPVAIIGAGGIVNDAHLPAYAIAGFEVKAICDLDESKAIATARKFGIPRVYKNVADLVNAAAEPFIYDLALPGAAIIPALQQLPDDCFVLLQKPMGNNLAGAEEILQLCRSKRVIAGVNFQLRYAPSVMAARSMVEQGLLGDLCDIEVNINVYTPWHLWSFLNELPRVEILYHSIHYIDLIRSFLGNPAGVYAKTTRHPLMSSLASVRSNIIMDYGAMIRANILTNHCHQFGLTEQTSYIKLEGTKGAVKIGLGALVNYPQGVPDSFSYILLEEGSTAGWQSLAIEGSWFPHAFIGSMAQVMRAAEGSILRPDNSVEDCIHTMACVEAAYTEISNPLPEGKGRSL